MELSDILMIIAILVEGPIVWLIASRQRKEDNVDSKIQEVREESRNSIRKLHDRVDTVEDNHATKEYVDDKVEHVKEVVNVHYGNIMETLNYIRSRVDEQSRTGKD